MFQELLLYGVVSTLVPWVTATNSLYPQRQSSDYTIALGRFIQVLTARRGKPARAVREKRKIFLVETDKRKEKVFHWLYQRHSLAWQGSVL